jgi:hypothetical protein
LNSSCSTVIVWAALEASISSRICRSSSLCGSAKSASMAFGILMRLSVWRRQKMST